MKKILGLTVAALLVMGLIGGGTWAYFSDPETLTGNVFQAGTIDLYVDGAYTWTGTLGWTDAKPDVLDTLIFKNNGTLPGNLTFASGTVGMSNLAESDTTADGQASFEMSGVNDAGWELSANQTAALIKVSDNGTFCQDLIDGTSDLNGDGDLSLNELHIEIQANGATYAMPVGYELVFTFEMFDTFEIGGGDTNSYTTDNMSLYTGDFDLYTGADTAWNVPQADGVSVDITVTLVQQ